MHILVVDDLVPDPRFGYGYPRSYSILESLAALGVNVTLYPLRDSGRPEPCASELQCLGVTLTSAPENGGQTLEGMLGENEFDAIWVSRPRNLKEVLRIRRSVGFETFLVYDAEALNAPRELLRMQLAGEYISSDAYERMWQSEKNLIAQANIVVSVSNSEAATLAASGIAPIYVVGHYIETVAKPNPFECRDGILFLGGFYGPTPNQDAIVYMVNEIFPLVRSCIDVQLLIAGYHSEVSIPSLLGCIPANISIVGTLDSVADIYNNARVFVVPTRWASGLPHKLHHALAHGLPSVVTPLIASQIGAEEGGVLVGEDPGQFARHICELYRNRRLWGELQSQGVTKVQLECSKHVFLSALGQVVDKIRASVNSPHRAAV